MTEEISSPPRIVPSLDTADSLNCLQEVHNELDGFANFCMSKCLSLGSSCNIFLMEGLTRVRCQGSVNGLNLPGIFSGLRHGAKSPHTQS